MQLSQLTLLSLLATSTSASLFSWESAASKQKRQEWEDSVHNAELSAAAAIASAQALASQYENEYGKRAPQGWQSIVQSATSFANSVASSADNYGATVASPYTSQAASIASSADSYAASVASSAGNVGATAASSATNEGVYSPIRTISSNLPLSLDIS